MTTIQSQRPSCQPCAVIHRHYPKDPQAYRMHCLGCVHCGARLIQKMQRLFALAPDVRRARSRQALDDWMAHGHSEQQLRALAKGAWAVAGVG